MSQDNVYGQGGALLIVRDSVCAADFWSGG